MLVELIPVVEIENYSQNIKIPVGPYWQYADEWEKFHQKANKKAGYPETLFAILKGSSFYRVSEISENNLKKLVKDSTEEMRKGNYDRDLACTLSGGYILRIDNQDKLYPQCCCDLNTFHEWEAIVYEHGNTFYNGHPSPIVTTGSDVITFNLSLEDGNNEKFVPTPTQTFITVEKELLCIAVEKVKNELQLFSNRLIRINEEEHLNIENLDKLLVCGDN